MPQKPYRVIDRRSSTGYSNNLLYQTATQTGDRKNVQLVNYDTHRNVSALGRVTMMSLGRKLFADCQMVRSAVLEQANLAVSTFIPQYYGANKSWGDTAENWLVEWHRIFDMRGFPFDFDGYVQNIIIGVLRDGDVGTLLTENPDGYPMIQVIPGHRIRSWISPINVTIREYQNKRWILAPDVYSQDQDPANGDAQLIDDKLSPLVEDPIEYPARLVDGVVINDYGAPIAYAIGSENNWDMSLHYVSSRNLFLTFVIEYSDQLRGLSQLASSAFDWQDVSEFRRFELIAQKVGAGTTLIETNEVGEVDSAKAVLTTAPTGPDSTNNATSFTREEFDGGMIRYFRTGTGAKLEAFKNDRPSAGQMQFEERILRGAFTGMEWSTDFSLDPSKVGGAQMRIVIEKINAVLDKRRRMVGRSCRRVDGYGLSKAIKKSILTDDPDWYKWDYQGPSELTADKKYDSDVDLQEYKMGFRSRKEICARRGEYFEDVDIQRVEEVRSLFVNAKKLAEEFKIPLELALAMFELRETINLREMVGDQEDNKGLNAGGKSNGTQ